MSDRPKTSTISKIADVLKAGRESGCESIDVTFCEYSNGDVAPVVQILATYRKVTEC